MRSAVSLIAIFFFAAPAVAAPANSCSDPYWKDTLRCAFFPNDVPQPNLDTAPTVPPGQPVPAFTRVFLDEPDIRCTDGTTPLMYVDKAVCTSANGCGAGIRLGDPVDSNRWLFTFSGGTSCYKEQCVALYADPGERGAMGSAAKAAAKEMSGIHSPDPIANPVFAGYNRVRVEKCTFDRYMGRSQDVSPGGAYQGRTPGGREVGANVYYHGFFIIEAVIRRLANGLRYTTWTNGNTITAQSHGGGKRRACCRHIGGQLATVEETLPPLASADVVLLNGHSNASHGLYHNLGNIIAALEQWPGFDADVRALFDANFLPSLENEASFATSVPAGRDSYDGIWSGTTQARGETFAYDGASYHATGRVAESYVHWKAVLDTSCLDAHAADGTTWKCRDRQHVLFNHIATPFMVREDFLDPNIEHLDAPRGHDVPWGETRNFPWCTGNEPCTPRFTPAEFRARLERQAETLLTGFHTRSELARGADASALQNPTVYVWMPECAQHEGAFEDDSFQGATIATEDGASFSMRQWLEDFMSAPRNGVRRFRVDGATDTGGGRMDTTKCK